MLSRNKVEERDTYIYNLKPDLRGLSSAEAAKRIKIYGANEIEEKKKKSAIFIFLNQFNDFMIWVLMGAAVISALMGEGADALTITAIIILNGIMGFIQEYRTEKSMEALKELAAPTVKAIRDGYVVVIPAREIVPDDIIVLESGDRVPADSILIEAMSLQADESLLTGESVPVDKRPIQPSVKRSVAAGAVNTLYMGTIITGGRGKAQVVSTGMATEMGKIADMLQSVEEKQTPLQERLEKLGKIMVYACLLACIVVTVTGILKGEEIYIMFLTGVSLAVAAIPEGLPAIVTVSLTMGVQRMLKRNALIRKLPAVETLGCTNVICSDKTGTLTENKMTVKEIYCDERVIEVSGTGYDTLGDFTMNGRRLHVEASEVLSLLMEAAVSCSNSSISSPKKSSKLIPLKRTAKEEVSVIGDPTEVALLILGHKAGKLKNDIDIKYQRVGEIPFDSDRKRMSVVVKCKNGYYVFLKGALDNTIDRLSSIHTSSGIKRISPLIKKSILSSNDKMAQKALRVLCVAYKKLEQLPSKMDVEMIEKDLVFLGLAGMIDPPREEVKEAVNICKIAGIKPVMITGDHKETAIAIANDLKLMDKSSKVLTGKELDEISDGTLNKIAMDVSVYARVTPKHKLRIVKAYKENDCIVAMTGDGVNDAPAIKEADIGVSMGKTGTDVTKEASAMVLLDDNFATIVAAVEEGRIIYDNIRKFIRYLLSCNLGEVLTMFLASLIGYSTPLLPIQILWVNLVTDGLPAIALGVDPPDNDIMLRHPRGKDESIFSHGLADKIIIRGVLICLCTITVFLVNLKLSGSLEKARTMAFATLVMSQLIHVFECRSERHTIFEINFFKNIYLIFAVITSICMLCIAIYIPSLQSVFKTVSLDLGDWIEILFFSGAISLVINLTYYIKPAKK
ncbi:calcium-transporting ATPase [Oxobacter pfennigii]|uniref:Calcium-transporting ATPase n=1 Tax=Oxobacter pfennigii TaxID=36849 RepID=A0A0P8W7M7_9CLOT|nr:cation-translocating P-type ATPase [Oxobacter pfennigii]KPU44053.1 calcium-transporting ATPase [Oxobacter pfennigii]